MTEYLILFQFPFISETSGAQITLFIKPTTWLILTGQLVTVTSYGAVDYHYSNIFFPQIQYCSTPHPWN